MMMVNPIDFGGHSWNVKVTMGIIDKFGVRGDATLCVVIFMFETFVWLVRVDQILLFVNNCTV